MSLSKFLTISVTLALLAVMVIGCGGTEPNRTVSERLLVQDFSSVKGLTFSPDGKRVAYSVVVGVVVDGVDGIAGKQYTGVPLGSVTFSPDSKRVAYATVTYLGDKWKWFVAVDGVEGKPYDGFVPIPLFSPDSQRLAYAAKLDNKVFMVLDGVEGKQYDDIRFPVFSPDSKQLAYGAKVGNKWLVVLDDREGKQYDFVSDIVFSPGSQRLAYKARIGTAKPRKELVVADGIESKQYNLVSDIVFSPDSQRFGYIILTGNKQFVVVDGVEGKQYDSIHQFSLTFSPDSKRLAYVTGRSVVVDGIEKKANQPSDIIFSPDSKRVAYVAKKMKYFGPGLEINYVGSSIYWVVVDGAAGKKYDDHVGPPVFSPDSKRVAYAAKQGNEWFVVVDGVEGKPYDGMFNPGYNSRTIWKGGVIFDTPIFDSPDSLHYLALTGNSIYLVEETIR